MTWVTLVVTGLLLACAVVSALLARGPARGLAVTGFGVLILLSVAQPVAMAAIVGSRAGMSSVSLAVGLGAAAGQTLGWALVVAAVIVGQRWNRRHTTLAPS